mmetsp:Transcript_30906/g.72457  ORF Transcript_30906/g.72457 Transcript_30906/m.72457 type:complete len:206 (+) Transcript_30906:84-701(+)|eukprot:s301_g3.t1
MIRTRVDMGATAHPMAAQRQEQILKEQKAEAEALAHYYGTTIEKMSETFRSHSWKSNVKPPYHKPVRMQSLPPVMKPPERVFSTFAPSLVGAAGLGQGPGNFCHGTIGGAAEKRTEQPPAEDAVSVSTLPPSRGSEASFRSQLPPATGASRASERSAASLPRSTGSRSNLTRASSQSRVLRQEIQNAVLQEVSRLRTPMSGSAVS